jgi:hypothetical protein
MSDIDVTFRNENNGKEVEVTVSDDMPADAILRNLAEAGLIPNTPGTAWSIAVCSCGPIRHWASSASSAATSSVSF